MAKGLNASGNEAEKFRETLTELAKNERLPPPIRARINVLRRAYAPRVPA